jgi:hypothetical protein
MFWCFNVFSYPGMSCIITWQNLSFIFYSWLSLLTSKWFWMRLLVLNFFILVLGGFFWHYWSLNSCLLGTLHLSHVPSPYNVIFLFLSFSFFLLFFPPLFFFFFFFTVLGFELRASCLVEKHSTTWAMLPVS